MYCDTILRNSDAMEAGCGVISALNDYSAKDKNTNQQVEKVTTVMVVAISFLSLFAMDFMINYVSEEANVLVESYVPVLMSMWIGLYTAKSVTYLYDTASDAILYCWVCTYNSNEQDKHLIKTFQKKLSKRDGYTLLEPPVKKPLVEKNVEMAEKKDGVAPKEGEKKA